MGEDGVRVLCLYIFNKARRKRRVNLDFIVLEVGEKRLEFIVGKRLGFKTQKGIDIGQKGLSKNTLWRILCVKTSVGDADILWLYV